VKSTFAGRYKRQNIDLVRFFSQFRRERESRMQRGAFVTPKEISKDLYGHTFPRVSSYRMTKKRAGHCAVGPFLSSLLKDTRPHDLASFGCLSSSLVVLYLASAVCVYMCISGNTKAQIECSTLSIPPCGIISDEVFIPSSGPKYLPAMQLAASRSMDLSSVFTREC